MPYFRLKNTSFSKKWKQLYIRAAAAARALRFLPWRQRCSLLACLHLFHDHLTESALECCCELCLPVTAAGALPEARLSAVIEDITRFFYQGRRLRVPAAQLADTPGFARGGGAVMRGREKRCGRVGYCAPSPLAPRVPPRAISVKRLSRHKKQARKQAATLPPIGEQSERTVGSCGGLIYAEMLSSSRRKRKKWLSISSYTCTGAPLQAKTLQKRHRTAQI